MPTTMTRVDECPECGGVMKSTWSDGKTRIHQMTCLSCAHQTDKHQNKLHYLEVRHGDVFEYLSAEGMDYDDFIEAAEEFRLDKANEAFDAVTIWGAVKVRQNHTGSYTVAAYEETRDDDEGVGDKDDLPYGNPGVSWTADDVMVNNCHLEMVNVNDGSAWVYLRGVTGIDIETDAGEYIRISV